MTKKNLPHGIEEYLKLTDSRSKLRFLVAVASLAPSSHNTQPWLFRLGDNSIEVRANRKRHLEKSDKSERQLYLSIGTCIGNLRLAAESLGLEFVYEEANGDHCGKFTFSNLDAKKNDSLTFGAIINRHNNRYPFSDRQIPASFLEALREMSNDEISILVVDERKRLDKIKNIVMDATRSAFQDKGFTGELSRWIRPSLKKFRDGMPGYNLEIPWPLSFVVPLAIRFFDLSKSQTQMLEEPLKKSAAYAVVCCAEDNPHAWLKAGEKAERLMVESEKNHIKVGILAAAIEMGSYFKDLQNLLGTSKRPVMFLRLGYADKVPKSAPRLNLKEIIVSGN